ncbi:EamA family transporter [Planosporangium sp. 12N6]|uniref:EamA family transporter n=1 Tax=Planosporangium spinosum TaxID=3402278 RepID=UPI003CF43CAE
MQLRHRVLAVVVAAIWGVNFVVTDVGLRDLSPLVLTALRFTACAVPLVFFVPRPTASARYVVAYGAVFGALQYGLLFTAMAGRMPAGMASLVLQAQAPLSVLLATTLLGERIRTRQAVGVVVASAGIGVLAAGHGGHATAAGFVLTLLAAAAWAAGNVIVRASGERRPVSMLAYSSLVPPLPLLALAAATDGPATVTHMLGHLTGRALLAVAYIAYVSTLLGFGGWNRLLGRYPVGRVAPFSLLVPVVGVATSAVVLGEPLTWRTAAVAAVVLVGLALVVGARPGTGGHPPRTTDHAQAPAGVAGA